MMFAPLLSALVALPYFALQVSATKFCQCEHPSPLAWKFGGIQHICKDLSRDWCSTNCNQFGANCDYCQFKPAGDGPEADYRRLVSWCRQQSEWDSQAQKYVRGTEVDCYSYKNRVPMKWSWTGCHHEDNGDWARDKTAYLRLKLEGGWYQRRGCSNLQLTDWTPLTNYFLERNPTCQAFNNKTLHYVLDCPYSGKSEDNKRQNQDFKDGCERQKGHWYLRHDGPDMVLADEMVDENLLQSPLNIPERYPPKLPQSLKHMSEADCMGREDDVAKKSPQQGKDSHGWSRRVVFEEDGVKVIFVDEEF